MKNTFWWLKLFLGPFLFLFIIAFVPLKANQPQVSYMAGITCWIAVWWLTEVVDLAVTSLLPLVLLPVLGILDAKTTAIQYNDQVIFLFVGGFIISFAIEKWGVHKRISLKLLSIIGSSPSRILAGVMFTTYFISMWMSNTATVMMLLAAVLAIIHHIKTNFNKEHSSKISIALLLGLAYSGSIGGMASLVGTPTNMIFSSFYSNNYPNVNPISFTEWFAYGFPISLILLILTFLLLKRLYLAEVKDFIFDKKFFKEGYRDLGKFTNEEKWVVLVFSITAILWFTRSPIDLGLFKFNGWSALFRHSSYIQDSTVAICMAVTLFIIPAKRSGEQLLVWKDVKKLPYDIILLFGSGFALAKGFEVSGLSDWLAGNLNFLKGMNSYLMILGVCVTVCIISEFASNVASIQLVLPILMALSKTLHISPLVLMIPATLAASLGYMLPVATAANTIVFGTKKVPLRSMLRAGFWVDLIGISIVSLVGYILID